MRGVSLFLSCALTVLCVLFAASSVALAQPAIARPVTDLTGVLSPAAIAEIEARLEAHHDAGHAQIALLFVHTTSGEPIADYANRAATAWGGGSAAADDGVLFVLALDDREMRIEVGYGLEATITDAIAMRILDDLVTPLREGRFDAAAWAASDALIARTGGQSLPVPTTLETSASAVPASRGTSEPHAGVPDTRADAAADRARRRQERESSIRDFLFIAAGFVLPTLLIFVFLWRGSNTSYDADGIARTDWSGIVPIVVGGGTVLFGGLLVLGWFGVFGLFAAVFVAVFVGFGFVLRSSAGGGGSGGRGGSSSGSGSSRHERSHRSHRSRVSSFGGGGRSYGGGGGGFGGGGASKRW